MSRSLIHMRRVLFGVSCTMVFGFGATQAFAERTNQPAASICDSTDPYSNAECRTGCYASGQGGGSCNEATMKCDCNFPPS
jgi:hypothetical protein